MDNIEVRCISDCNVIDSLTCQHFPKIFRGFDDIDKRIYCVSHSIFERYYKLIKNYNLQIHVINGCHYFSINDIMILDFNIYAIEESKSTHTSKSLKLLFKFDNFDEVCKYLDDNGYGQKPMIQMKFVD